jgi:hypothetical protein
MMKPANVLCEISFGRLVSPTSTGTRGIILKTLNSALQRAGITVEDASFVYHAEKHAEGNLVDGVVGGALFTVPEDKLRHIIGGQVVGSANEDGVNVKLIDLTKGDHAYVHQFGKLFNAGEILFNAGEIPPAGHTGAASVVHAPAALSATAPASVSGQAQAAPVPVVGQARAAPVSGQAQAAPAAVTEQARAAPSPASLLDHVAGLGSKVFPVPDMEDSKHQRWNSRSALMPDHFCEAAYPIQARVRNK